MRNGVNSTVAMADNYVIDVTVEVDGEAYDDPMDALTHVNDILNQSEDITGVDTTMRENPNE